MTMMRWEPFKEMMSLRNAMDRLFDESYIRHPGRWPDEYVGNLAMDMYQTDNEVVVKAMLPGVNPEEVDISITNDVLTIKGEHKEEQETKGENYLHREIQYGMFNRSMPIPVDVQSDKAEATFENGLLTLTLPKAEKVKPKQIKIKPKTMIEGKK